MSPAFFAINLSKFGAVPLIPFQINFSVFYRNPVSFKASLLLFLSSVAEAFGKLTLAVYHLVAGVFHGIGICVQGVSHGSGKVTIPQVLCNLTVGNNLAAGDSRKKLADR